MNAIACRVVAIESLTPVVNKVLLAPAEPVSFIAGQYLQLCLTPTDKRPFSIASTPADTLLELHIGTPAGDSWSSAAMSHIQHHHSTNTAIMVEVGLGQAQWRQHSERPIILLAGGTGFSYVHSIAMAIAAANYDKPVFLYWGVRHEEALYYATKLKQWADTHSTFHFIPVVQEPNASWTGKVGLVHQAVLDDFSSLDTYDIYMAGPFAMAGVAREAFAAQGGHREHMFADAFAYI